MPDNQEACLIASTETFGSRSSLGEQLRAIRMGQGGTILVHTSLSALGWIVGGAVSLIQALQDFVGPNGTVVMPTHSSQLSDPAGWNAPPVPKEWIDDIKLHMPAYESGLTPTRSMGAVAELFRTSPGARRSTHPSTSFAATGKHADWIIADHLLESPLGENSPLAKLYDLDAIVLLLGVGFDVCTMLHLAEQRAWPERPLVQEGAPLLVNGIRQWTNYQAPPLIDSTAFIEIGNQLVDAGMAVRFRIGTGTGFALSSRQAVDWATAHWRTMAPLD